MVESQTSILGYATAAELGILRISNAVSVEINIFQRYPSLFCGLGKMKNVEVKLYIDECVNSIYLVSSTQKPRGLCRVSA